MNLEVLSDPDLVVFTTRDYAAASRIPVATASRQLGRAADQGVVTRVTRGVWANVRHPFFHPLACVPALLGNEEGHVSFLTALHLHGVIEQIPAAVQVATTGHARKLATPVGRYEFLHLKPVLLHRGVAWSETRVPYRVATAEKALLDTFYVSLRRGRRFRALPELDLRPVKKGQFLELLEDVDDLRSASAIRRRFDGAWAAGRA